MIRSLKNYINRHVFAPPVNERDVVEAYDLWARSYDAQPGNLMLDLDELLFTNLLTGIDLTNKNVADIGCGTGRHWPKVLNQKPASLTGFDVSPGMLDKLKAKFPGADAHTITDNSFCTVRDDTFDLIISTLTVAHIEDIEAALEAWCRILKYKADIIITDFHPDVLAFGGKRTFNHGSTQVAVRNFVHQLDIIKKILQRNRFAVVCDEEKKIDETVAHYYAAQNALHVYEKFKGFPVIYGLHFRRC
ncbi:MAG TPA: methyltransferase domain-containing protein [Mucilaginibacter sp.]|nr:methyltransferase domain-containing protein [Mucilaginibacter sp.]